MRVPAIAGMRSPAVMMPHRFNGSAALIVMVSPFGGVRRISLVTVETDAAGQVISRRVVVSS